jgi:hyperosmotically inducible protein
MLSYHFVPLRVWAVPSLLSVALALTGTACSAALSTVEVQSAQTAAMVTTALVNDPEIGSRPIEVRVTSGVVTLSGRVHTEAEAARAIALARAVPGVSRVDSTLRIGGTQAPQAPHSPPERPRPPPDPEAEFRELESSRGWFAVGATTGASFPAADGLESAWSFGPLMRIGSGTGFGLAVGFDWYRMSFTPPAPATPASALVVRPIMAGISYTVASGRVSISPSIVGGYAFNRVSVPDAGTVGRLAVDAGNSFAWRPAVSMWINTSRRTAAYVSIGHVRTSPTVTFIEDGRIDRDSLAAHATMLSVGLAYTLF